jgi:hypothetical protein
MRLIVALCLAVFFVSPVLADGSADPVVAADHAAGSAASSPATPDALPDPVAAPLESAGLLYKLYKAGHLIPAIVVFAFFLLTLLSRWVAWFKTGYRKLIVASTLAGLAMIAERAAAGTTPNLAMLFGAFGVAFALYTKGEGEPEPAKA